MPDVEINQEEVRAVAELLRTLSRPGSLRAAEAFVKMVDTHAADATALETRKKRLEEAVSVAEQRLESSKELVAADVSIAQRTKSELDDQIRLAREELATARGDLVRQTQEINAQAREVARKNQVEFDTKVAAQKQELATVRDQLVQERADLASVRSELASIRSKLGAIG